MQTGPLRTLPYTRHRNANERQLARDGIAALNAACLRIGAQWLVHRDVLCGIEKQDTIQITFADSRELHVEVALPEDYGSAADHAEAFIATPTPDETRFDDSGHGIWTNAYV